MSSTAANHVVCYMYFPAYSAVASFIATLTITE